MENKEWVATGEEGGVGRGVVFLKKQVILPYRKGRKYEKCVDFPV